MKKIFLCLFAAATAFGQDNGEKLIQASDCSSCHALDRAVVGPSYAAIAKASIAADARFTASVIFRTVACGLHMPG